MASGLDILFPLLRLEPDLLQHLQHHLGIVLEAGVGRFDAERPDDQVVGEELLHLLVRAGAAGAP